MAASQAQKENKIRGSCACGKVKFTAEPNAFETTYCYCTTCRKCSGNAFLPFTHFHVNEVQWESPPDEWRKSDVAVRGHCSNCGTSVSMLYHHDPGIIGITLGCIDEGTEFVEKVSKCIFVGEKPDWVELPSGIPQQSGLTPGFLSS